MFTTVSVNDVWRTFDEVFKGFDSVLDDTKFRYPTPSFPQCDIWLEEDGSLYFNFALAGYSKDDIEISFDEDYMILSSKIEKEVDKKKKFIRKSLKKETFTYKYLVPSSKFNQKETTAEFKDGILEIIISPTQKKEKINVKIG